MAIDKKAPKGKYKVILRVEDLDNITPSKDSFHEIGIKDTIEEATKLADESYVPGSKHGSVWNDEGVCVYPK